MPESYDDIHDAPDDHTFSGVVLIAQERQRQLDGEHWTAEHDDLHTDGELARAAMVYAAPRSVRDAYEVEHKFWPMSWSFKPGKTPEIGDRVRELAKAGALIAAEIDRLRRLG